MNTTPKTIQIFLPQGDPRGIRIADITTRLVQAIEVPRSLLPDFLKMPESAHVALYFLWGEAEDDADATVYVGQTGDLRARLIDHNKKKDFWQRVVVVVAKNNQLLTQTHALFLEWRSIQALREAGRYKDENGNSGSRPHTPAPLEAECHEIFETAQTLLSVLGYSLFDAVLSRRNCDTADSDDELFFCTASGANSRGMLTSEGFVVMKDSVGRRENVPSLTGTPGAALRQRLLDSGAMLASGQTVVFQRDHLFRSPSMAALALMGRTCNGWVDWKNKNGKTLSEVKR
jgi:predicted GIY-YIG superfamily endonuclease